MKKLVVISRKIPQATAEAWIDRRVVLVLCCFAAAAAVAYAAAPQWWTDRGVLKAGAGVAVNDYAVANQGQLKNMARAARDELLAKGYIDASHAIHLQIEAWRTNTGNAKDYAPVNLGQLKAVAKPIYDVLKSQDPAINYPWSSITDDDKDYAVANIGQLKHVFGFAIPDLLHAPTGLTAGAITASSITLAWQDINSAEQGYRIERSLNNSEFELLATVAADVTSYPDTGLAQNTDYYYRVVATRTSAESSPSNVVQVRTLFAMPTAPVSVTIANITAHGMRVGWTAGGTNQTYFQVQVKADGESTWADSSTVAEDTQLFVNVSGLSQKTNYAVRVGAANPTGVVYSSEAVLRTLPEAPAAPSGLALAAATASTASLTWEDTSSIETSQIIESSTDNGISWATLDTISTGVTSYQASELSGATSFLFRALAINQDGSVATVSSQPSNEVTLVALPDEPMNVVASSTSWNTAQVDWTLPSDPTRTGVRVRVWKTGESSPHAVIDLSASDVGYQDTGLSAETTYQYQVAAVNVRGETVATTVSATTSTNRPSAPSGLTLTPTGPRAVNVAWTDNSSNETSFVVERSTTSATGPWVTAASLPVNTTTYPDSPLQGSTQYFYRVKAANEYGETPSSVVSVTTDAYSGANHAPDALAASSSSLGYSWSGQYADALRKEARDDCEPLGSTHWVLPADYDGGVVAPAVFFEDLALEDFVPVSSLLPDEGINWDADQQYGVKVVVSGSRIFVAAPNARHDPTDASSARCGAVYVFDWNGSIATQSARIAPTDGAEGDRFGAGLACDGERVIIGAPNTDVAGNANAGKVYLYDKESSGWVLKRSEISLYVEPNLQFGFSVALRGRHFVIGAPCQDVPLGVLTPQGWLFTILQDAGSVYFGIWNEAVGMLNILDNPLYESVGPLDSGYVYGVEGSHFGASLALNPTLELLVGAPDGAWSTLGTAIDSFRSGSIINVHWNGRIGTPWSAGYGRINLEVQPATIVALGRTLEWNPVDQAYYFASDPAGGARTIQTKSAMMTTVGARAVDMLGYDEDPEDPLSFTVINGVSTTFGGLSVNSTSASSFEVFVDQTTSSSYLQPKVGSGLVPGAVYSVGIRVSDDRGESKDFNLLAHIPGQFSAADYAAWLASHDLTTAASGLSLGGDGLTTWDKYLRHKAGLLSGINPKLWDLDPNGDEDGDTVINSEDAEPFNAGVGRLQVVITQPVGSL